MKTRTRNFHTAIIGAGASGTLAAVHFLRAAPADARLALVESGTLVARGVAYGTSCRTHLLNVRASNMSAFPDEPDHFVRWLTHRLPDADTNTYAPRMLYGDYLADVLNSQMKDRATTCSSVVRVAATVVELTRRNGFWTLHLQDGDLFRARTVVLALGNLPPDDPVPLRGNTIRAYFRDPWTTPVGLGLSTQDSAFLIGTGLTMVDVALSLRERGHRGRLYALSRHGYLPQSHRPYVPRRLERKPDAFSSPVKTLRWLRSEIELARREGYDWRAVIESIRPYTSEIWRSWNSSGRSSFLRHARTLWDVHRHRMAPEVGARVALMIQQGTLSIHHGRITALRPSENGVTVTWRPEGTDESLSVDVARAINCTGPARDYSRVNLSLLAALRDAGWLTPDPLRLGVETDEDGRLLGADGGVVPGLFTLGPLRIPGLWESIAIPEIRSQAAALAKVLVTESTEPYEWASDSRLTA